MRYYTSGYTPPNGVSDNASVERLQNQLNSMGARLNVDGIWGPRTQAAYQQYMGGSGNNSSGNNRTSGYSSYVNDLMQSLQSHIPRINYTPQSENQLRAQLEKSLRPMYDSAIADRREQTASNKAGIDLDAASRGMGSSTWVTDAKSRQLNSEASDIASLEGAYGSNLASQLYSAMQQERANQLNAEQYNASMMNQALQNAISMGYNLYNQNQSRGSGGGGAGANNNNSNSADDGYALYTGVLQANNGDVVAAMRNLRAYTNRNGYSEAAYMQATRALGEYLSRNSTTENRDMRSHNPNRPNPSQYNTVN